jgi:hypothetical protein
MMKNWGELGGVDILCHLHSYFDFNFELYTGMLTLRKWEKNLMMKKLNP